MNQPTGALDFRTSLSVLDTIERANQQLGTFTVIITHNAILGEMADSVICLCGANLAGDSSGASAGFLDPRARAQAEAAVQSAEATCMQRNEQVNSAAAELDLGRRDLIRAQKLKDTDAIALQAFDLAMNRVEVLEDQLASAKFASRLQNTSLLKQKPLSFTSRMRVPVGA